VTGTGTPEENRRIGRNTLLLQMINPGAGGETAENSDLVAGRDRHEHSADKHLHRITDHTWR
jgi:hypothetical protein